MAKRLIQWALATALFPSVVVAQSEDIYRAQARTWLVAPQNGQPGCTITLDLGRTIGGRSARPGAECEKRLPAIANAAAWDLGEGLVLRDPTRKTVALFTEDETAILTDRDRNLIMVPAVAGVDRLPHAPAIFGRWTMRRPGGPALCQVALGNRPPPGGQEGFSLTLEPGCDDAVARLKLASWRVEGPYLMLYGNDGQSLGFALTPGGGFAKRKEDGGRPLVMDKSR